MITRPVSVIICTHNRAHVLPLILNQLRGQDYPADAFEIIVVDNCSTDGTCQVVERFIMEPGVPVRYVAESRPGVTFARNRGAEAARYPYLAYIDDDCAVKPDWLKSILGGFDLDERVVVVGGLVILDWADQKKPSWIGPGIEPWLGVNSVLGSQPRLLEKKIRVLEGNMALTREAWHGHGGFLGMERFGSRHVSAGEVIFLLKQIERKGEKVAFVPGAVARHHVVIRNLRWFLRRAYWQGVSDGILDYLLFRRSWRSTIGRIFLDSIAMLTFIGLTGFSIFTANSSESLFYLMRAIRRTGLILSEMRLVGNWPEARFWISTHRGARGENG